MDLKQINAKNFAPFGRVIGFPPNKRIDNRKDLFCKVLVEARKVGWRIAYLVVRQKIIRRMEQHLNSFESFEPVCGRSIIYLAKDKISNSIQGFHLDKPIVLNKGIWHGIVSIGDEAEIKITENAVVETRYWRLAGPLTGRDY